MAASSDRTIAVRQLSMKKGIITAFHGRQHVCNGSDTVTFLLPREAGATVPASREVCRFSLQVCPRTARQYSKNSVEAKVGKARAIRSIGIAAMLWALTASTAAAQAVAGSQVSGSVRDASGSASGRRGQHHGPTPGLADDIHGFRRTMRCKSSRRSLSAEGRAAGLHHLRAGRHRPGSARTEINVTLALGAVTSRCSSPPTRRWSNTHRGWTSHDQAADFP